MKKFLASILKKLLVKVEEKPSQLAKIKQKPPRKLAKPKRLSKTETIIPTKRIEKDNISKTQSPRSKELILRDFTEMMEIPFFSLSKNRTTPLVYINQERGIKVSITAHRGHFLASIYDWDIIIFVEGKMQEILNSGTDLPPRTMTFPRHEILKTLRKHDGKKEEKDLEKSMARLKLTGIETTIRNEDHRYKAGFGFLDSWGYTERKDVKEIHITLSQWFYDGICAKGALIKISDEYFELTSGIKKFLYRTARKHVGHNKNAWEFSVEKLYEKSGSEREFKKFKYDLKIAVQANDLPEYDLKWIERNKNAFVNFKKRNEIILLEESKEPL
jgi:plasmid replication initiation protein